MRYEHEPWLTLAAALVAFTLFLGGVRALGVPF